MYVQTYVALCTTIQIIVTLIYYLGLLSVAFERILLSWQQL